ncbi:MAG: mechanosensitive ion channel family protein, partial [Prevotella sp.]|nr:mechanosensitive ion channel family protein [Prevotella sp.]
MSRRIFLILALVLWMLPLRAVLKEKDINSSLAVLRHELTTYHREQQDRLLGSKLQSERVMLTLRDIMQRSSQNSLMLYSQKSDYVFDLTYACHEATEQYEEFQRSIAPFKDFVDRSNSDIARYDSLIDMLSKMPTIMLNDQAKTDRNVCLTLAVNIRRMLKDANESLQENMRWYEFTEQRLKSLNDYANKRYKEIQTNIFQNGGDNYIKTLTQMNWKLLQARSAIAEKYTPTDMVKSQWDIKWIIGLFSSLFVYGVISILLNFVAFRFIMTRLLKKAGQLKHLNASSWYEKYMAKRTCITLATSVVTLAIILGIIRLTWQQNFLTMASSLLIEYAWLLAVILISLLLRVDAAQIKSAFRIYSPLMVVGFLVIAFRIVLIPNDIVDVVLPPILLVCSLWQWSVIRRHNKKIPRYDVYLTYTSLSVFAISVICSWLGYTLLAVQLLIWWIMQMTCLLT